MADTEGESGTSESGAKNPAISPNIRPNLRTLEGGGQGASKSESAGKSGSSVGISGSDAKSSSPSGLKAAENGGGSATDATGSKLSEGKGEGFWKGGKIGSGGEMGTAGKAAAIAQKAKADLKSGDPKLLGGGILAIIFLFIILLFSFGSLGSFELSTIANRDKGYQSESEEDEEDTASRDMLSEEDCMQVEGGCPSSVDDDVKPAADAEAKGETLATDAEDFKFTDPVVEADLGKAGIEVDTSGGNFTGLSAADEPISPTDIADDTGAVFDKMEIGLPSIEEGQTSDFIDTMVDNANSSFDIFPDTQSDANPNEDIDQAIVDGAPNSQDVIPATAEENDAPPSQGETPSQAAGAEQAESYSKGLAGAENAVMADILAGDTEQEAIKAVGSDLELGSPANVNVALQDICMADEVATEAAITRVPEIMTLDDRTADGLLSMDSQTQAGRLTGAEERAAITKFNGDQSKILDESTPGLSNADIKADEEAAEPFSDSEEWQDAIGNTGAGTAMDPESLPIENSGTSFIQTINSYLSGSVVGEIGCEIEDNPIGGTIGNILGGIEDVADEDATFGVGDLAQAAAVTGLQEEISDTVFPDIIEEFTPIGESGAENSVQFMDNVGAGMNMSFNNYARRLGAIPLDDTDADTQAAAAVADATKTYDHQSWADRTFATSNPKSLISQLAVDIPLSHGGLINGIADYLSRWPEIITHGLADIFVFPAVHAAQPPSNPGTPYYTTQYGFPGGNVDTYAPLANEQYLFSNVTYGNQSMSRISMLGNPDTYTDSPSGDSSTTDLLHCFVDSFYTISTSYKNGPFNSTTPPEQDPGADQNCGALGLYDNKDDPVTPQDVPNNQTVASIYCTALGSPNSTCQNSLISSGQVNNDVVHFGQYLMDLHVMSDLVSLTTND